METLGYKEGVRGNRRWRGKWVEAPTLNRKELPEEVNFQLPGTGMT